MTEEEKEEKEIIGIICTNCHCRHFEVVWTRPRRGGIARCRACRNCGKRITTREQPAEK